MGKDLPAGGSSLGSVTNALRLLSLLTEHPSIRVVDAADYLGIALSTAHRLLSCLRDEGFLQQANGSRRYTVGPETLRIARHFATQHTLEHAAHHHLQALCRELNETVNLQILLGAEVLCVDAIAETSHTLHVKHIAGQRTPANASAAGKLLLSVLDPDEVCARFREGLPALTAHTIADPDTFQRELEAVRNRGYATNIEEGEEGVHAVAVAIMDTRQRPMAALSVASPAARLPAARVRTVVPQLRRVSSAITAEFFAVQGVSAEPRGI
ncbi:IclR family transcriptional regulator [Streptomyces sp. NPDC001276]|uniref:IclR family transcriptional regulator n=1 Tax=unclassified Streptomyces TaxID=2593676 RepID=UPI003692BD21